MLWQIGHFKAAWQIILVASQIPKQIPRFRCISARHGGVVWVRRRLGRVESILRYSGIERGLGKRGAWKTLERRECPLAISGV